MSKTKEMAALLTVIAGHEMDANMQTAPELRTFWNTYMTAPWTGWTLGHCDKIPSQISNNQPIEIWHRWAVKQQKSQLKKGTMEVVNKRIPDLMKRDSIVIGIEPSLVVSHNICLEHIVSCDSRADARGPEAS
jgi:hypothetical protein